MLPIDDMKSLSETGHDGAGHLARLALAGQEKMIGLNIDALQELIKKSGSQLEQTLAEVAEMDLLRAWPYLLNRNWTMSTSLNLSAFGIATRLQKDLAATAQFQMHAAQSGILEEFDQYSRRIDQIIAGAEVDTPRRRKG
ncbi:MAG: hypothetical protein ACM3X0_02555 [Bacteroidota bacterium]